MPGFDFRSVRPLIVSGPCSAESREQLIETCDALSALGKVHMLRAGIWKPRTQPGCFEGVGKKGLKWLREAGDRTGLPVTTEVASAAHVEACLEAGIDVLWVGARTTVSPFAVQEIADAVRGTDVRLMIKNPMNPDINLWDGAVQRFLRVGIPAENMALIHRGFSYFGHSKYRNPPMWHIFLDMRSRYPSMPILCDASHMCGCRDYLQEVSQTAADLMFDGLFLESHRNPSEALSDAKQQLTPDALDKLLDSISWRKEAASDPDFKKKLDIYRQEIDQLDSEIFELLGRRMGICENIGLIKKENNVAILQSPRWGSIVDRALVQAKDLKLSEDFIRRILEAMHLESIARQDSVMNTESNTSK